MGSPVTLQVVLIPLARCPRNSQQNVKSRYHQPHFTAGRKLRFRKEGLGLEARPLQPQNPHSGTVSAPLDTSAHHAPPRACVCTMKWGGLGANPQMMPPSLFQASFSLCFTQDPQEAADPVRHRRDAFQIRDQASVCFFFVPVRVTTSVSPIERERESDRDRDRERESRGYQTLAHSASWELADDLYGIPRILKL